MRPVLMRCWCKSYISIYEDKVRTGTTIQIHHPVLFPDGIFEYQHSVGATLDEALNEGFRLWLESDWYVLLDVATDKASDYMRLEMTFDDVEPAFKRRISFGNVLHYYEYPPAVSAETEHEDEHDFCPCCLLTHSLEAFQPLLQSQQNYAIRLFASRDDSGKVDADCRVNGEDWDAGLAGLKAYAEQWPDAGFEFRKQYVVVRNVAEEPLATDA